MPLAFSSLMGQIWCWGLHHEATRCNWSGSTWSVESLWTTPHHSIGVCCMQHHLACCVAKLVVVSLKEFQCPFQPCLLIYHISQRSNWAYGGAAAPQPSSICWRRAWCNRRLPQFIELVKLVTAQNENTMRTTTHRLAKPRPSGGKEQSAMYEV